MKKILLLLPIFFVAMNAFAQNDFVVVQDINITGHKRTQTKIILRELDVQKGDTIQLASLEETMEQNRLLLMSSGLFSLVEIEQKISDNNLGLNITVEEAWYLYPFFNIEFADRNFNIWWVEKERALNRLNYNFQVSHRNLTGRKDLLKGNIQFGYEPKFQLTYDIPYINEAQTVGFRGDIFYAQAKEWGLNTFQNKLELSNNGDTVVIRRFRLTAGLRYQKGVFQKHEAEVRFHRHEINDFASDINPDFFLDGNTLQRYFALTYKFTADYRDFKPYPLNGSFFSASLHKEGFGIFNDLNTLYIEPQAAFYKPISKKFSTSISVQGKVSLLRNQTPYFNTRAIGYRFDYMRGYEYYVVDGLDYAMARLSLRYEWLDKDLAINKKKTDKQRQVFPLKIYSTVFHDEAFVNNPFYAEDNDFANQHLWSIGTGLNFVIYNDFVLRFEYTWNHLAESDLYIHFALPF